MDYHKSNNDHNFFFPINGPYKDPKVIWEKKIYARRGQLLEINLEVWLIRSMIKIVQFPGKSWSTKIPPEIKVCLKKNQPSFYLLSITVHL